MAVFIADAHPPSGSLVERVLTDVQPHISLKAFCTSATQKLGHEGTRAVVSLAFYFNSGGDKRVVATDAELHHLLASLTKLEGICREGYFAFTFAPLEAPPQPPKCCSGEPRPPTTASVVEPAASLSITVNGRLVTIPNPSPSMLLADFIRDTCGLRGTKVACGEGGCGACTVMVRAPGSSAPMAINSCLRLLCACDGWEVTTVEGFGSEAEGFSSVQQAIADGGGSQCGFCTPGWVVGMSTLLETNPTPSRRDVEMSFDGHICRCTGYRPILEAFKDLACGDDGDREEVKFSCRKGECSDIEDIAGKAAKKAPAEGCKPRSNKLVRFQDRETGDEYWKPSDLNELILSLEVGEAARDKAVHVITSNTGMAVVKYYREEEIGQPPEGDCFFIDLSNVSDLKAIVPEAVSVKLGSGSEEPACVAVGAAVAINELIECLTRYFDSETADDPESSGAVYQQVLRHFGRIANLEVRAIGSWGGNVALAAKNPAFASDMAIVLAALGVDIDVLVGLKVKRMSVEQYFRLVRGRHAVEVEPVIIRGYFPRRPAARFLFYADKTAQRHVNAHAIVNFAALFNISKNDGGVSIVGSSILAGGLGEDNPLRLDLVERSIAGENIDDDDTLQAALSALDSTFVLVNRRHPSLDVQNSPQYRLSLARAFLFKAFLYFQEGTEGVKSLPHDLWSAAVPFAAMQDRRLQTGIQSYPAGNPSTAPVGDHTNKLSARLQASGEAKFSSDLSPSGCVYGQFVIIDKQGGGVLTISEIDVGEAIKVAGFIDFVSAEDIPGRNFAGSGGKGKIFYEVGDRLPCVGCAVGLVVADSRQRARAAAKKVMVTVVEGRANDEEPVINVKAARLLFDASPIAKRMRLRPAGTAGFADGVTVTRGDVESFFEKISTSGDDSSLQTLEGRIHLGGQKHFFLETNTSVAEPDENNRIVVTCGTQFSTFTQETLSKVLGVSSNKIEVKVRRVGGAFGGKINLHMRTAAASAIAAVKLRRPVMIHNERVDDMTMMGGREPIVASYRVAFDKTNGSTNGLDMLFEMDGASNALVAVGSLSMATQWSDGCYFVENFRAAGNVRFSARPENTSARAPGNLQSIAVREFINEHIAKSLNVPLMQIQEMNMYVPGQTTPFGDVVGSSAFNWTVPTLWQQVKENVDFDARLASVNVFNSQNRFRKRGIAMVPTKYGMTPSGYSVGCLINVLDDKSIEVFHSGSEIGQGINTKVAQAVAYGLGCDLSSIVVGDNSSAAVPNGGCTGGSGTSETCVGAALLACEKIMAALKDASGSGDEEKSWETLAKPISATGWFTEPAATENGSFDYATQGVCFAEVEVDVLTGEIQIRRADIHMDLGASLNPAIDIGQIEGGFIMALGYFLCEEVLFQHDKSTPERHAENQIQINLGTWNYKVPSAYDIPEVLNVSLLDVPNPSPAAILSSKACAEPPMALACAVVLAAKECIYDARSKLHGLSNHIQLDIPLTTQRIQEACLADAPGGLHLS